MIDYEAYINESSNFAVENEKEKICLRITKGDLLLMGMKMNLSKSSI